MNRAIIILLTFAMLIVTGCNDAATPIKIERAPTPQAAQASPAQAGHEGHDHDAAPRISLAEAKKAFDDGTAVFIDTHVKAAYDAEHIRGAINISVQDLPTKVSTIPKGKKIIAYCS
ncbi:MAG: rhodanese-like domain-containing protein [Blastocatellia bacterium]|nr:rhodanese-like domain-containing protein [Blastocatellia bacterium]